MEFHVHGKTYEYCRKSIFCFHHDKPVRKFFVWVAEWNVFKHTVLIAVIANAVIMTIHNYKYRIDENVESTSNLDYVSARVFVAIFSLEFIIKVIAFGFVLQSRSYLRNGWNILDFLSLLSGLTDIINLNSSDLLWLRTLRVIKPLRSIKVFPQLQKLVRNLFASMVGLVNIYMFLTFILAFFATLGVNLFAGYQNRACRT